MKRLVFAGVIFFSFLSFKSHAQTSGFYESQTYDQTYTVSDVPVSQTYYRYNNYGQVIGVFQRWKYAQWDSATGSKLVYTWNGYAWQSTYVTGTYYWFNWIVYEKQIE